MNSANGSSDKDATASASTSTTSTSTIYKVLTLAEWNDFQTNGVFSGTLLDQKDGYIHMSYKEQVRTTIQKFFNGQEKDIVIVHINTELLHENELRPESNVKPDGSRGTIYPHIYGTIPIAAVITTTISDCPL